MRFFSRNLAIFLLAASLAGCLGGQPGSGLGSAPGAGSANPGGPSGSGTPSDGDGGGGAGADSGDGSAPGGSYFYSANSDATASSAKPLPGGAVATGGIWEDLAFAALKAKGTLGQCSVKIMLSDGSGTGNPIKNRLQGEVLAILRNSAQSQAISDGCSEGDYLYAMEFGSEGLVGCNYFPLAADCSFDGYINFQYSSHLKFYVYHTSVTVYPSCEALPVTTLLGQKDYPDSFFVEVKDEITSQRFQGEIPACP